MIVTINNKDYKCIPIVNDNIIEFEISCDVTEYKFFCDWISYIYSIKTVKRDLFATDDRYKPTDIELSGCLPVNITSYSDSGFYTVKFTVDRYYVYDNKIRRRENSFIKLFDDDQDK